MTDRTPRKIGNADPIRDFKRAIPADQRDEPVTITANDMLTLMLATRYAEQDRHERRTARAWFWSAVALVVINALTLIAAPTWWRAAATAIWVCLAVFWAWAADWKVGRQP